MTRHTGSVPAAIINLAHQHLDNGERDKAAALLGAVLRRLDPATAPREDGRLLAAAQLWCQAADDDTITGQWARYVHEATFTQHGSHGPTVNPATEIPAPTLAATDDPLAVVVRDLQLQGLLVMSRMSPAELAECRLVQADLLHLFGSWTRAIELAQLAWVDVCQSDSDTILVQSAGATLIRFLTECGRTAQADGIQDQLRAVLAGRHPHVDDVGPEAATGDPW
jgi:hypothetical protein